MSVEMFVPDIEKTFGILYYAGIGSTVSWKAKGIELRGRFYLFFSELQKGESIEVLVLWDEGEPSVEYDEPVLLINPRVLGQQYQSQTGGGPLLFIADGVRSLWEEDEELFPAEEFRPEEYQSEEYQIEELQSEELSPGESLIEDSFIEKLLSEVPPCVVDDTEV